MTGGELLKHLVLVAGAAVVGLLAGRALPKPRRGKKGTFVLAVFAKFQSEADRDVFIEVFKPLAKHVKETEAETVSYELSIADTDPTKIVIYERYTSKEALTELHQQSEPFKAFKKAVEELGISLEKSGQSYYEQGIGWM